MTNTHVSAYYERLLAPCATATTTTYTGQEYAQVVKMLGNGRCECFCFDGVTRLGHIRGKMRKKVWITAGDIVLVGKRDFQDEKVDIVHKYSADEARNLKQYGELPETARINETAVDMAMAGNDDDDDIGIDFDGENDVSTRCTLYVWCAAPFSHPTFFFCALLLPRCHLAVPFCCCQTFKKYI
jgi:translation initiation factor 1A